MSVRIAKTIDYLKAIKQTEIDGTEGKEISITFPSGQTRQFTGQNLLLGNSLPNFYFHATTAYDIIRRCGVEIGKRDFEHTADNKRGVITAVHAVAAFRAMV